MIGYVFKCEVSGFGGALQVMVGINIDGTISGAKVTNHSETVGLGAQNQPMKPGFRNIRASVRPKISPS